MRKKIFDSHHAYLVEGNSDESLSRVKIILEEEGMHIHGNPDFHIVETEALGVDDSRKISELAILKPFGEKKVIVIHFDSATGEAQNALLKTLEDPTPDTHFILITPHAESLLPTLMSRLERVELREQSRKISKVSPELFLKSTQATRLELLEKIIKDSEKGEAIALIDGIEKILYESGDEPLLRDDTVLAFTEIARARKYIGARGSSLKLILSHLALALPISS